MARDVSENEVVVTAADVRRGHLVPYLVCLECKLPHQDPRHCPRCHASRAHQVEHSIQVTHG